VKRVLKFVGLIILLNWVIGILTTVYQYISDGESHCLEYSYADSVTMDHHHSRTWQDLNGGSYCLSYGASSMKYNQSRMSRHQIQVNFRRGMTHAEYWGLVYKELILQNKEHVSFLLDSLNQIAAAEELDRNEFAELIVTFVQDIPYVLIDREPCSEDYLGPCKGDEPFGILAPYEFLYSLEGDCDTRAVLLYALLKEAGYQPLVVVSREYTHAMIALNVLSTGDFITYGVNKYYFWETTNTGWRPGMLPPDASNIDYWKVALSHEL
jgi:hypothetical protein